MKTVAYFILVTMLLQSCTSKPEVVEAPIFEVLEAKQTGLNFNKLIELCLLNLSPLTIEIGDSLLHMSYVNCGLLADYGDIKLSETFDKVYDNYVNYIHTNTSQSDDFVARHSVQPNVNYYKKKEEPYKYSL